MRLVFRRQLILACITFPAATATFADDLSLSTRDSIRSTHQQASNLETPGGVVGSAMPLMDLTDNSPSNLSIESGQAWNPGANPTRLAMTTQLGDSPQVAIDSAVQLTLQDLQGYALAGNPSIRRAEALVQAARGKAYQVGMQKNPEIGFDFQQVGSGGQAEQYGVSFGQQIIRREKRDLNRSVELHEARRLEEELRAMQQRVLTDVHLAYIRVLRAQRQTVVAEELLQIDRQALQVAEQLLQAKEVARTDVLRAEVEVDAAQVQLREAQNRYNAAWRQLEAITGYTGLPRGPLAGDLTQMPNEVDYEATLSMLRTQSPEIASLLAAIERARCYLRRQQIEPRPDVTVGGLINWRDNGIGGSSDGAVAVSIPVPVWDKNRGAIQEARYQLVSAQQELHRLELALGSRLAPVYERYATARQRVDSYRDSIVPKAAETLQLVRETYELGEVGFDTLLQTQRTYAQTQLAYIDALEQLQTAVAEINGMLLSGSLGATN